MTSEILRVQRLGKAFLRYSSEWKRMAGWLGMAQQPLDRHWALRDVTFSVARGESVGLIGRNGAGKSTLLKLIAGTLRASEGTVTAHGRVAAILELGMGFNPEFTGRQNALHAAGLMGIHPDAIHAELAGIEDFAAIGEYFDQPTRIYSSGMQMRVAFAVATAFTPDLLLIDEALAVGDLSFQAKCFARIETMRASGCALLFVSHSVEEVVKHCARALFVDAGALRLDAPSREVANAYLDHLWGHARGPAPAAATLPAEFFGSTGVERFTTRPFYRADEHRWGAGGARIVDYYLESEGQSYPSPVRSGARLRIVMQVRFERAVEAPVYGLLIKTLDGIFLFGTNSAIAGGGAAHDAAAGDVVGVEFALPVGLNSGAFLVSLGVSVTDASGALQPIDRRYDSILLQVVHDQPIWGLVDLGAECRILESTARVDG